MRTPTFPPARTGRSPVESLSHVADLKGLGDWLLESSKCSLKIRWGVSSRLKENVKRDARANMSTDRPEAARYRLRFLLQEFDLASGDTLIGRGDDCHITIYDPSISRHHARIIVTGGRAMMEAWQPQRLPHQRQSLERAHRARRWRSHPARYARARVQRSGARAIARSPSPKDGLALLLQHMQRGLRARDGHLSALRLHGARRESVDRGGSRDATAHSPRVFPALTQRVSGWREHQLGDLGGA